VKAHKPRSFVHRFTAAAAKILAFCAVILVFTVGISTAVQHWLTPENKAKIRLKRAGYSLDLTSAFRAIELNDQLSLERLHLIGVNLGDMGNEGFTTLGFAAQQDRLEVAKKLIGMGVPVEAPDKFGRTPLSHAIESDHTHVAKLFLEQGGDPNVLVAKDVPALAWTVKEGREHMFKLLLTHGADVNADSAIGSPLHLAIENKDLKMVKALLTAGADAEQSSPDGEPLLLASVTMEWPELTRELLTAGADPNSEYQEGMSRAVLAMQMDRPELARELLEAGANPNARAKGYPSVFQSAFEKRDDGTFLLALEKGGDLKIPLENGHTMLQQAVAEEDKVWTERLLAYGANPNQMTPDREPLWWNQLSSGRRDFATMLLSAGADVNGPINEGARAIDLAIEDRNISQARYLFKWGATSNGYLWHTLQSKDYSMMRFLLANGEDPNALSNEGITPVGYTIMTGDMTAAALLMEYGAEIDTSEKPGGQRLLEWAIANKQLPILERLLDVGVNPNTYLAQPVSEAFLDKFEDKTLRHYMTADSKITPLMVVAGTGQHKMAQALLDHGASTGVYTRKYKTWPINFATRVDDVSMTQILLGRDPDPKAQPRKIIISLSEQRVRLYEDGKVKLSTRCSTGKSGYSTPKGTFVITNKDRTRISNLYDAEMPYFMRLSCSAIGMHQGYVPSYPASHGCIRLPEGYARTFFKTAEVGDIVVIQ